MINNFVDVQRFTRKPIDAFKKVIAPNGERILLHASNFRKIKTGAGCGKNILRGQQRITMPNLLFVGDGPERQTAEELCRELNVCDEVRL